MDYEHTEEDYYKAMCSIEPDEREFYYDPEDNFDEEAAIQAAEIRYEQYLDKMGEY